MAYDDDRFIQVHGRLRGEYVYAGGKRGRVWLLHDFVSDDGVTFEISSRVTETVATAAEARKGG